MILEVAGLDTLRKAFATTAAFLCPIFHSQPDGHGHNCGQQECHQKQDKENAQPPAALPGCGFASGGWRRAVDVPVQSLS